MGGIQHQKRINASGQAEGLGLALRQAGAMLVNVSCSPLHVKLGQPLSASGKPAFPCYKNPLSSSHSFSCHLQIGR